MSNKWSLTPFEYLAGAGLLIVSGAATSPASVVPVTLLGGGALYMVRRSERLGRLAAGTPAQRLLVDGGEDSESTKLALPAKEQERRQKARAEGQSSGRFRWAALNSLMDSISSQGPHADEEARTSALEEVNPAKAKPEAAQATVEAPKAEKQPKQATDAEWVAQASAGAPEGLEVGKVASLRLVVEKLNKLVDDFPHLFVVGDSGAGKTTLVQLIVGTRPGKVVILDQKRPKGWEGPKWGGLPYVARDKQSSSYKPLVAAMQQVVTEMTRRYRMQDEATEPFEMLTVVLDEAKNSVEECEELAELYRKIVSIGREVNVRLILISTTDRARKLGFDGEADSMDSFAWVVLGDMAVKTVADVKRRGDKKYHWALVSFAGGWVPFENEKAFGLLPSLNLKRTKAWAKVEYNCQTDAQAIRKAQEDEWPQERKPAREMALADEDAPKGTRELQAIMLEDEQRRPVVNGYVYTDDDIALLARLTAPKVSRISADESADERLSARNDASALSTALSVQQDASFAVSAMLLKQAQDAAEVLKTASDEERSKLRNSLQVWRSNGAKKMDAIQRGFDCKSGDKYVRGKELFDAAQTIAEYQAARNK